MAYTTINKSTDYFNTVLYTGDGNATQAITNTFQTDFSWIKDRGVTAAHTLQDAVRTWDVTKKLTSNDNDAENNASGATWGNYGGVTAVGATSFTTSLGSNTPYQTNANGSNYVAWNWKAGGGQGSSNTDGSINTTYTSVNTTAGFSVSQYAATGSNATVGHGLGAVPKMILVKQLNTARDWSVYHVGMGNGNYMNLNATGGSSSSSTHWNSTTPTSSVFSIGTSNQTNENGNNYIAYCFAEKSGYSKFGSWVSNNNADGVFVYTGFAPSFVMLKESDGNNQWVMYDNKRPGYNQTSNALFANANSVEATDLGVDLLSNGYKIRATNNQNTGNYIYMAFGQSLVGTNNVPCTAR